MFPIRQPSILARSDADIVSGSVRAWHDDSGCFNRLRGGAAATLALFPHGSSSCQCRPPDSFHDNRLTWGWALLQSP
jgi:hypothetical protein